MAKAINWPAEFRDTVLNEPIQQRYAAVRLGRLYYDNQFWVPEEVVDIRVNSLVVRRGVVKGELWCGPVAELSPTMLARLKPGIQTLDSLVDYLKKTYNQAVGPTTEVTVVQYENLPLDPAIMEYPRR